MLLTNKIFRITEETCNRFSGLELCLDRSGFNHLIPEEYLSEISELEVAKEVEFHFELEEAQNFHCFEKSFVPPYIQFQLKKSLRRCIENKVVGWELEEVTTSENLDGGLAVKLYLKAVIRGKDAYSQIMRDATSWDEDTRFKIFTNYLGEGKYEVFFDHLEDYDLDYDNDEEEFDYDGAEEDYDYDEE